jgi:NAD(P)-dependent dehydrogenase (short-subunit alcohol dehydrogenase family)
MNTTPAPTVLVTGATGGIGFETARRLALAGSTVILHGPTELAVGRAVAGLVRDGVNPQHLDFWAADFTRLGEVRAMAQRVHGKYRRIDVLINNAATAAPTGRRETEDGNELTFQVNYLAPYLLTRLLADRIANAPQGRMVAVSSQLHRMANINWADPQRTKHYAPLAAYAQSKLALTMFTRSLAAKQPHIATASVHPGVADTDLLGLYSRTGSPVSEAAAAVIHLCSPQAGLVTGAYYDKFIAAEAAPLAQNRSALDRLWKLSAHLVGLDRELAPMEV